jgi:hypothetical protein
VDLRYSVAFSNSITISPTSAGAVIGFQDDVGGGLRHGNVSVPDATHEGAGHVAFSAPFNLITPILLLSPQRPASSPFTCTVSSERGQHLEILASTNLSNWITLATLTNSTGTTNFTDSAAGIGKRFYRAHSLP